MRRPDFNKKLATSIIGKRLLVGLTYINHNNETTANKQFHGEVIRADQEAGIVLRLHGSETEFYLPADTSPIEPAPPGDYRLQSSGEVVVNPDFLCTYEIHSGRR
ncbi:hypothetical protein PQQ99_15480 [Paraburkholderia sediminicola]|uniref:hypothetical protein n=1 Tax=Paraburkholderia sediminicola TaxID=458836 RepID=UPI0038B7BCFF